MNNPGEDARPRHWPRPPLWLMVTVALLLLVATAFVSIVGPTVVENWTVERLKKRTDVAFYWGSDEVSWNTGLISEIHQPKPRQIELKADFPRESLPLVKRLRQVKALWVESRHVLDDDLILFRQLRGLDSVGISGPTRTLDAFRHIDGLSISTLTVTDIDIPVEAMAIVAKLPRLRHLSIGSASFVDSGFAAFRGHPTLESIYFDNSLPSNRLNLSAADLETIGSMPVLKTLALEDVGVSNAELRCLPATLSLATLKLRGTEITDEGLVGLQVDPELLRVYGTSITFGESTEPWLKSRKRRSKIDVNLMGIPQERIRFLNTLGPAQLYDNFPPVGEGATSP
jgi:hypothetical protein